MKNRWYCLILICVSSALASAAWCGEPAPPIEPREKIIRPFNGKDLSGFTTWLRATDRNETEMNYSVTDGTIHISGEGMGYLATVDAYQNYHLSIDYKWGQRTDGSKYVRNSGILLHASGPEGNARGIWMASIEVQLAQGCEGDLIVIRGKDQQDQTIPVNITSDTVTAADGRTRWQQGGKKTLYTGKQFWWSKHEVGFQELLDTRGKQDLAVTVHRVGKSDGGVCFEKWAVTAAIKYSYADRSCRRHVSDTVSMRSMKRLPVSLCVPKLSLR